MIRIVDSTKLHSHADFLVCEILDSQFASQVRPDGRQHGFTASVTQLGKTLGFEIERYRLGEWFAVSIQPSDMQARLSEFYDDTAGWDIAGNLDLDSRVFLVSTELLSGEICAIAFCLDPECTTFDLSASERIDRYSSRSLAGADELVRAICTDIIQSKWLGDVPQNDPYWQYPLQTLAADSRTNWQLV